MTFTAKEIIDMAVAIEENGVYFYNECAKKYDEESIKETFLMLKSEEVNHRDYFADMLSELPDAEGEFSDEYFQYLNALTKQHIFRDTKDIDRILETVYDITDVLRIAIQTEKDSILWYLELLGLYNKEEEKTLDIINKLIQEEKKHITMLYKLLEQ